MRRKCLLVIVAMTTFSIVSVLPASLAQGGPSLIGQEGSTPTEVFHGTVYSSGGKFVLRDESRKAWYQLDDQRSARPLEGKQVRVIGILDGSTKTIHVESIEEDPVHSGFKQSPNASNSRQTRLRDPGGAGIALVRFALSAQTVDATPRNQLIREYFLQRPGPSSLYSIRPVRAVVLFESTPARILTFRTSANGRVELVLR